MKNSDSEKMEEMSEQSGIHRREPAFENTDGGVTEAQQSFTVKNLPADEQPREKVLRYGIESVSNADLFAIILRTGTRGYPITTLCRDLMEDNNNLFLNLERKSREEIMGISGIGQLKAMQIEAVMEIVRRYCRERIGERVQITRSSVIFDLMRTVNGNLPHEEMWAIFVNRSNHVTGTFRASVGGSAATVFDSKKIIRKAILARAEGIILCHNHPSGNLNRSPQDDVVTRRFKEACATVDINFLDHVIVTSDGYYSYHDNSGIV